MEMTTIKKAVLLLWTFPLPLLYLVFRGGHIVGDMSGAKVGLLRWWPEPYVAVALYPGILLRSAHVAASVPLMVHEMEHIRQQEKFGGLLFLVTYGAHYLWNFFVAADTRFNHMAAYGAIFWEKKATEVEIEARHEIDRARMLEIGLAKQETLT